MANRIWTFVLIVGTWLALALPADAQPLFRRFGSQGDRESPRPPRSGNPEHERKKTDADKAIQGGDFPQAIELTDEVLRQNPGDAIALYLRGSARVELGVRKGDSSLVRAGINDSREAIRIERNPRYYLPYLHGMKSLALLDNRREHAEMAVTVADQTLGVAGISNEDKANLLYQRAQANDFLGKTDQAIADMEEALRAMPNHFGARAAVAEMLAAAGKNDPAQGAFNKLVESFPDSPLSYNNRGRFLQRQGKHDEAVVDFTRAVEREPNYFISYTNRGFSLLQMDNPVAAEADLTQSLKLNPQQPFVYNLRGLSKLARGDIAGAIQDQRAAVEMTPKDPVARADLGFLFFFSDDFAGAVDTFDAALAIEPQFRHLNPWKIAALQRLGKTQNLKEQFGGSLTGDVKRRDWIDHQVAFLLGAETEADLLAAAAGAKDEQKTGETCEAYYFIAAAQAATGKTADALDAYQKAVATKARQLASFRGAQFALKKLNPAAGNTAANVGVPVAAPGASAEEKAKRRGDAGTR